MPYDLTEVYFGHTKIPKWRLPPSRGSAILNTRFQLHCRKKSQRVKECLWTGLALVPFTLLLTQHGLPQPQEILGKTG